MEWTFNIPTKFTQYTIEELKQRIDDILTDKESILIASKRLTKTINLQKTIDKHPKTTHINDSLTSLNTDLLCKTLQTIKKRPEQIIAIGGGTTIDLAKTISALYTYTDQGMITKEDLVENITQKKYLNNTTPIPIIASSTTAGTGSDCTKWATVWDYDNTKKYSVDADYLYPKESWLVSQLTHTLPVNLTISTALDALSHASEAYWSKSTNPVVQVLARDAITLIVENLPQVLKEEENMKYRDKVYMGAFFAGLAFTNTRTTACHSISYPLTLLYNIPHGYAVALTLTEVMKRNQKHIPDYEKFLQAWKAETIEDIEQWIQNITQDTQPLRLRAFNIKKEDIKDIVKLTFTGGRMDNNPIIFTEEEVQEILENVY